MASYRHGIVRRRYGQAVVPYPMPMSFTWQDAADLATVCGVLIALLVGIATTIVMIRQERVTRAGQDIQRLQSEAAAARTEAAAALTADYSRRVVEALESIALHGATPSGALPEPVRWTLIHQHQARFLLENRGGSVAKNVRISAHPTLPIYDAVEQDIGPNEAMTFYAARTPATRDSTITVTWDDAATSETRTWRYPLPPTL